MASWFSCLSPLLSKREKKEEAEDRFAKIHPKEEVVVQVRPTSTTAADEVTKFVRPKEKSIELPD